MNRTFERRQRRNDEAVASTLYVEPIGITYQKIVLVTIIQSKFHILDKFKKF